MNSFLSKWSSSCIESTRLLLVMKKTSTHTHGCMNYRTSILRNSMVGNMFRISTRNVSISCRFHVSFVYKVSLKTGDKIGAGTDSNIYIRMIGALGSTDEVMLKTKKKELERGMIDNYHIVSEDVGPLKKIIIRHDNTGFGPGWYLDWVSIRDGKGKKYNFNCDNWLITGESYGNIKLLKEDSYVDLPIPSEGSEKVQQNDGDIEQEEPSKEVVNAVQVTVEDLGTSNILDNEILKDLKSLEELSDYEIQISDDATEVVVSNLMPETDEANNSNSESSAVQEQQSTKHASSLSPAVRNLLDTYDIDVLKVPSSGRYSRRLKGDVLAYISKENITRKKFVVNMTHPVETKQKPTIDSKTSDHTTYKYEREIPSKTKEAVSGNYMDHVTNENAQLLAQELRMSKLEVPHLYMSISCSIDNLDTFTATLEQDFFEVTRNVVFVRILSKALLDTFDRSLGNESMDILVTHNGISVLLKNCDDAEVVNIYQQYKNFEGTVDSLIIPPFGLNIIDTEGVCQLSSILRVGQLISLCISGTKLGVDVSGKITQSVTVAISCDSRIISEETCALLLVNCKKYFANPNLLGL